MRHMQNRLKTCSGFYEFGWTMSAATLIATQLTWLVLLSKHTADSLDLLKKWEISLNNISVASCGTQRIAYLVPQSIDTEWSSLFLFTYTKGLPSKTINKANNCKTVTRKSWICYVQREKNFMVWLPIFNYLPTGLYFCFSMCTKFHIKFINFFTV